MLTNHGMLDTGMLFGESVYSPPGTGIANQYAAMPSLHVAWAALVAIALIVTLRSRWRWLALVHPILTMLVVVATANHYWIDGLVGLVLLTIALVAVGRYLPAAVAPLEAELAALPPAPVEPAGSELVSGGGVDTDPPQGTELIGTQR
jgi:membrane-associated phospholipid phosphatase